MMRRNPRVLPPSTLLNTFPCSVPAQASVAMPPPLRLLPPQRPASAPSAAAVLAAPARAPRRLPLAALGPHATISAAPFITPIRTAARTLNTSCLRSKAAPAAPAPPASSAQDKQWSHTLQLPKTRFDIRANAAKRDLLFHRRTCHDLYRWQLERPAADPRSDDGAGYRGDYVFHDGPPYANGSLHCGHALNKILKDIANRYQLLQGKRVHYMPGWDCHGLPIEAKAFSHLRANERDALTPSHIRQRARREAESAVETQMDEFRRFGIMADWSPQMTYRTLDPAYEARQLRVFGEMARRGLIYRRFRPVYWSPSNRTALAEAELEYKDDHLSKAAYVNFDLIPDPALRDKLAAAGVEADAVKAVIWTTTPWSLASNMAINVNPDMDYSVVRGGEALGGRTLVVATERIAAVSELQAARGDGTIGELRELLRLHGSELLDSTYRTPLMGRSAPPRPILAADYVTAVSGTGLVHSAPAHGSEDYEVWRSHGLLETTEIFSPIDDRGCFTADLEQLEDGDGVPEAESISRRLIGKEVLGDGAKEMLAILSEKGALLSTHTLRHKYPYDWRSKQPVIVRATSQWFANLDKIKHAAIEALQGVTFVPESSRTRLESFVRGRSEWCISRQRVWGVPIPVVYDAASDEPLLTGENVEHIARLLESKGTDYWWQADAEELVAPQYRVAGKAWRKGEDTVDVWFDSGTSWATARDSLPAEVRKARRGGPVADVYLEGSDQHRGWFQSSLLTAVATAPEGEAPVAPFKTVVTHGYVLDKDNRKMSKSLGNTLSPLAVVQGGAAKDQPAYGIDVLRLWAARSDYTTDLPIGTLIISKTAEALRKLRNTARFMLANLPPETEVVPLDAAKMSLVDRYVLHELYTLERTCARAYEAFDFAQVVRRVSEFANGTLSTLYLDLAKDCLYIDAVDSDARTSMVSVIDQTLRTFTSVVAPIAPFLAEDIHHYRNGATSDPEPGPSEAGRSVFTRGWQGVDAKWQNETLAGEVAELLRVRDVSLALIEEARQAGHVKTSFEVEVDLVAAPSASPTAIANARSLVRRHASQLTRLFNVARVNVLESSSEDVEASAWSRSAAVEAIGGADGRLEVRVRASSRTRCPRCRTLRKERPEDRLCLRCEDVVSKLL
ncbi:isoleucine-tRNA ligase [Thecaphora frezii]